VARAEAYLHAKFHLDPSNNLTTVHESYRQTDGQDRQDRQWTDNIMRTVLQTVAQKLLYIVQSTELEIFTHIYANVTFDVD